jgi:hypothetical protein
VCRAVRIDQQHALFLRCQMPSRPRAKNSGANNYAVICRGNGHCAAILSNSMRRGKVDFLGMA